MTKPVVFTPATLAKRWDCSEQHVRNLINRGELPSFRLGGKLLRIRGEDVEAFECQNGASQDCGAGLRSRSTETEDATAIHSTPMIRAKLNALRQPSMRS